MSNNQINMPLSNAADGSGLTSSRQRRGRPRWEPPELEVIEKLASRGLTEKQIAEALDISTDTILARKNDFPGFSDAIKKGKAQGLWSVSNGLFQAALEGNVTAAIYYLKNRDPENWSDRKCTAQCQETQTSGKQCIEPASEETQQVQNESSKF